MNTRDIDATRIFSGNVERVWEFELDIWIAPTEAFIQLLHIYPASSPSRP